MNSSRVMVFAGAGASFAVDRSSYPTTVGFYEQLPDEIRSHDLVRGLAAHFEKKFSSGPADIEKLLWSLGELIDHFKQVNDPSSALSWVIPNNMLQEALKLPHPVNHYSGTARQALPKLIDLRDRINAALYDCYSNIPSSEQLAQNWLPLLSGLKARKCWTDIVTTNYDIVIEEAIRVSRCDVGFGRTDSVVNKLNEEIWRDGLVLDKLPYQDGLLTKLHGSLNWERDRDNQIAFGGMMYKSRHEHHVAIYPGFKGIPRDEPFVAFHNYFERAVRESDVLIFIGFAFRDDYINDLLSRSIDSNRQIVVLINPDEVESPISPVKHISAGFSDESVAAALAIVEQIILVKSRQ